MSDASALLKKGPIRRRIASRRAARSMLGGGSLEEGGGVGEVACRGSSVSEGEEAEASPKPWAEASREVYEEQLDHLHGQLMDSMLRSQALQAELEERVQSCDAQQLEVDRLRVENAKLRHVTAAPERDPASELTYGGSTFSVSSSEEGFERVSVQHRSVPLQRRKSAYNTVKYWLFDFLSEFTEDSTSLATEEEEPKPLNAKRLKENVTRFVRVSKPVRSFVSYVGNVTSWSNPSESLVAFLVYMYCVWSGWLVQLLLFLAIFKLSLNYLHTSGLAEQFGIGSAPIMEDAAAESLGLTDKLHLIKQVAQAVQNYAGDHADNLERAQNLVLWHQPEATKTVYMYLWGFLAVSVAMPTSWTLTLAGLAIGIKLFVINNVYRKYPKVKEKHDSVAKLWASLPTNAELLERQALTTDQLHSQLSAASSSDSVDASADQLVALSDSQLSFCTRFQLSPAELPLSGWAAGRKCTLLDKDKPLIGSKGGRLYLTHSFLCFEKTARVRECDRLVLALKDILHVTKAKPFAVLPGSGMAVQLSMRGSDKPLVFGAIFNREQVLHSIQDQGTILGLPWGTDPDAPLGATTPAPQPADHTTNDIM